MSYYSRRGHRGEDDEREESSREESRRQRVRKQTFKKFNFFTLPNNTNNAVDIAISTNPNNPTILASLEVHADHDDAVWLNATIGWRANTGVTHVLFKIWRDVPLTGTLVTSALVGGESGFERNYVTTFSHVDNDLQNHREHVYFLTAEVVTANTTASVTGPLTFTAVTIEL